MPDWQKHVRARLGALGLDPACEQEIIAELAGHLEDRCEEYRWKGAAEDEAAGQAIAEVSSWAKLGRRIRRAKQEGNMKERLRNLWLPGFAISLLTMGLLTFLNRVGPKPNVIWLSPRWPVLVYVPWLVCLPVIGALGAYWSRRAGGGIREAIAAGLFPVTVLATMASTEFVLLVPVALLVDRHVSFQLLLEAFAITALYIVVIPGAALLVGISPFLRRRRRDSSSEAA